MMLASQDTTNIPQPPPPYSEDAFRRLCRRLLGPANLYKAVPIAMIDAGGRFLCRRYGQLAVGWSFIAPLQPPTADEARFLDWAEMWMRQRKGDATIQGMLRAAVDSALDVAHAAERLDVSSDCVRRMVQDGALGGIEIRRGQWRIARGSLARLIERRAKEAAG